MNMKKMCRKCVSDPFHSPKAHFGSGRNAGVLKHNAPRLPDKVSRHARQAPRAAAARSRSAWLMLEKAPCSRAPAAYQLLRG